MSHIMIASRDRPYFQALTTKSKSIKTAQQKLSHRSKRVEVHSAELNTQETNRGGDHYTTDGKSMSTQDPLGVTTIGARRGTEIMETQEAQIVDQLQGKEAQKLSIRTTIWVKYELSTCESRLKRI